jgi:beta-RFAP synthase
LLVSASRSAEVKAIGDDAERAEASASRFLEHHRISDGVRLQVHRAIPPHAGLGSGTQLALAIARALSELHGLPTDVPALARAVGRARRSAVGTWTFAGGGLVVEGGRHADRDDCGPLIARLPFPDDWRCVVAVPDAVGPAISGAAEDEAFASLPAPSEREVERVSHVTLMGLLPAVADGDLGAFGRALTQIQEITGCWFAAVQGGVFARGPSEGLVRKMSEWGAQGVGQSSWGPSVYGIVQGDDACQELAARVRELLNDEGEVFEGPFRSEGARVFEDRRSGKRKS